MHGNIISQKKKKKEYGIIKSPTFQKATIKNKNKNTY